MSFHNGPPEHHSPWDGMVGNRIVAQFSCGAASAGSIQGAEGRYNRAMTLDYDQWMGALCLYREARGCSTTQMNAIWWVLNNRANDPAGRWPKFISDVVTQPYQFSSFNANDPNVTQFPTRKHTADWNAFQNCMFVVSNPLGEDPTNHANSYHSFQNEKDFPSWADPSKLTVVIGPFHFYAL